MRNCDELGGSHVNAEVKLVPSKSSWLRGGVPRRLGTCKYENQEAAEVQTAAEFNGEFLSLHTVTTTTKPKCCQNFLLASMGFCKSWGGLARRKLRVASNTELDQGMQQSQTPLKAGLRSQFSHFYRLSLLCVSICFNWDKFLGQIMFIQQWAVSCLMRQMALLISKFLSPLLIAATTDFLFLAMFPVNSLVKTTHIRHTYSKRQLKCIFII